MSGKCGRPKRKPKTDKGSIYLTREVFRFDHCDDGNVRLFIGTKTNNIGYLSFKAHGKFEIPNVSVYSPTPCSGIPGLIRGKSCVRSQMRDDCDPDAAGAGL